MSLTARRLGLVGESKITVVTKGNSSETPTTIVKTSDRVTTVTVDVYLDSAPEPQQTTLRAVRAMLAEILPDGEEGISYGVPAVHVGGKAVAGYAYAKKHCSYFPHSGSVLNHIDPELLAGYDWGKGTLRFPIDQPPDVGLIRRLVEVRLAIIKDGGRGGT
ncbi:MAG: DUF1801 domain-containing protein, partial [Acidimicrobiia bacterium]